MISLQGASRPHTPYWLLLIMPVIIFFVGILLMESMYPIYVNSGYGFGPDAAYVYLFAALEILQGRSPVFIDHPGTPVQILTAIVIQAVWLGNYVLGDGSLSVTDSVLLDPELYLRSTSYALIFLTATASLYLGTQFYRATSNIILSTICQMAPLAFPLVLPMMAYPTAESFLQIIAMLLVGVLTPFFFGQHATQKPSDGTLAACAGILCGIGLATKLSFFPVLSILLILTKGRRLVIAVSMCVVGWAIGIAPIWQRVPTMFNWFRDLIKHSGLHGQGDASFMDYGQFIQNIKVLMGLFSTVYGITLALCTCLAYWTLRAWQSSDEPSQVFRKSTFVLLSTLTIQILAVAKHPGPSYMIAVLPVSIFSASFMMHSFWAFFKPRKILNAKLLQLTLAIIIGTLVFLNCDRALTAVQKQRLKADQSLNQIKSAISQFKNPILIGTFNCNFQACATWFGIALTHGLDVRLNKVNSTFYYFDIFSKVLRVPGSPEMSRVESNTLINSLLTSDRDVLLISIPYPHIEAFERTLIQATSVQNLYKVTGFTENKR